MKLFESLNTGQQELSLRRRLPLVFKIFLSLLIIVMLPALVLVLTFYTDYQKTIYRAELEKGQSFLTTLSQMSKRLISGAKAAELTGLVSDYARSDTVLYVTVVDNEMTVLADSVSSRIGSNYAAEKNQGTFSTEYGIPVNWKIRSSGEPLLELKLPLAFQDGVGGTAYLGLSQEKIDALVANRILTGLRPVYMPLIILLLLVFCLSVLFSVWIRFPLYKIRLAIQGIRRGDFNTLPSQVENSEFAALASDISELSNNLREKETDRHDISEYLSRMSMDRLLESSQVSGSSYASRRQVAVIYVGIEGFGEYAIHARAETVVEALNEYIGLATNTILANGGYVDKFMGDALVGIFGVSVYREGHTRRAVKTAWELQSLLHQRNDGSNQLFNKVRTGISSGVVLSGNIGAASRVEYSSIGECIKEAFWLNGLAAGNEVIISKGVYQSVRELVCAEALTPQKLVGHDGILESYRLQSFSETRQEQEAECI